MKPARIIIALLIGLLAIYIEFQDVIKGGLMGGPVIFKYFLVLILIGLGIIYLVSGIRSYRKSNRSVDFVPFLTSLVLIAIIFSHIYYREFMDKSESAFTAYSVGKNEGREMTEIDFKKNGHLKVIASYKFASDYFWGSYRRQGDTLILNINTDFKLGQIALIAGDTMRFIGDVTYYRLLRNSK
jgi:hypothetical protein